MKPQNYLRQVITVFATLTVIVLWIPPCDGASQTITIGTGTSTWGFPMNTYYHDSRTQVIYLASEIGLQGSISALSLDVVTVPEQPMNNWTIRIKHTDLSSYGTVSFEATGWTVVYQADETVGSTGWRTFNFTNPFEYNGFDNLMIDFSHNNSFFTSEGFCRASQPGGIRSAYAKADSYYGDPLDWSGTTLPSVYGSNNVLNIQLTIVPEPSTLLLLGLGAVILKRRH